MFFPKLPFVNKSPESGGWLAGPTRRYAFDGKLEGHHHSGVYLLSATTTGRLLASAGEDGLRVHDLEDRFELSPPSQMSTPLKQISALRWITGADDPWEVLCFGNIEGYIRIWRQNIRKGYFEEIATAQLGEGQEVISIASDRTPRCTFRIAVGHRNQIVQVWTLDPNSPTPSNFTALYSVKIDVDPLGTYFYGPSNDTLDPRKLLVLGWKHGKMLRLHETNGTVLTSKEMAKQIGDVSFNEDDNVIAIDNTVDGFDLHAFDNGAYVRTLPTTRTESRLPRQVAFAENGHVVVGGGNDGMIYVFDRRSGVTLDTLCHEPHVKGSQTLTTFDRDGIFYIASASSDPQDASCIYIWKYTPPPSQADQRGLNFKPASARSILPTVRISVFSCIFTILAYLTILVMAGQGTSWYFTSPANMMYLGPSFSNTFTSILDSYLGSRPHIPSSSPSTFIASTVTISDSPPHHQSSQAFHEPTYQFDESRAEELLDSMLQTFLAKMEKQVSIEDAAVDDTVESKPSLTHEVTQTVSTVVIAPLATTASSTYHNEYAFPITNSLALTEQGYLIPGNE